MLEADQLQPDCLATLTTQELQIVAAIAASLAIGISELRHNLARLTDAQLAQLEQIWQHGRSRTHGY